MTEVALGFVGMGALFVLILLRMPIGFAMGVVGFVGFAFITSLEAATVRVGVVAHELGTNYAIGTVPLFLLMAHVLFAAGIGQRLYCLTPETGVSAHPDRPVFLFNAGNGQKHREVNAPMVRTRLQLATDRLPLLLVAVVAGAFLSIYAGRVDPPYPTISMALVAVVAAALLAWAVMTVSDRRGNRRRAERLEDELSAAQESVEAMNHDIAERHALARSRVQDDAVPREGADG